MKKQKTCKEKIAFHLKCRMDDLCQIWEDYCNGGEGVEGLGTIYDYGLSFDYVPAGTFTDQKEGYFRYQLSYGGPSDEFRFFVSYDENPYKIEYWFLDWFDGAKKEIQGKNKKLMLNIWEWFKEVANIRAEYEKAIED